MKKYFQNHHVTLYAGDTREVLSHLPDESVNCCITSPPYYGLRDYGTAKWRGGDSSCNHQASQVIGIELNPEYCKLAVKRIKQGGK